MPRFGPPPTRRPLAYSRGVFCFAAAGGEIQESLLPSTEQRAQNDQHRTTSTKDPASSPQPAQKKRTAPMLDDTFHVYDTTLRDGAQQEGLNLSVADKLVIARQLDELGVGFIEGGWPGAIPKDTEFFRRATTELDLKHAQLAAFGATRRPGVKAAHDPLVAALRVSGSPVVTLVAKSHDRHVLLALRTTLEENLAIIADTVTHLREHGQRVFLDAEHFFDGYKSNPAYALEVVRTAAQAGAAVIALCDTNGA